ncbi:MAG: putative RDD family membrane protein YckC [Acidimicrobiales bacterium]
MAVLDSAGHLEGKAPTGDVGGRGPTTADPTLARSLHAAAVVTPEAVLLEFRAAGIGSRLLAKGIDLIVQFIAFYALVIAGAVLVAFSETVGVIFIFVSIFLIFFAYPTIEAFWNGQTVGKKVLGIKVITVEGGPVRFRHAAIRSMVWLVEFLLPPGGLFALAAALLTRQSQRIGDLAAGTVVIRSAKVTSSPVFFSPAFGAEHFSATFDAGRVTPAHYALVREFLLRAHELTYGARLQVAERLAGVVSETSGRLRPAELTAEHYLISVVFAYQKRFASADVFFPGVPASPPAPIGPPVRR